MEMQQFFNLVLLTLSVATILLTLVSYILYRLRQLPVFQSGDAQKVKVQGVFFKRYLPQGHRGLQKDPRSQAKSKSDVFQVPRKIVPFFGVLAGVIFCSLTASMFFGNRDSRLSSRQAQEMVRNLRARGLLRSYEPSAVNAVELVKESINPEDSKYHAFCVSQLKGKTIDVAQLGKPGDELSARATQAWISYLNSEKISYQLTHSLDGNHKAEVLILPGLVSLSRTQRSALERLLAQGISLVATGPIGLKDGKGGEAGNDWTAKVFGVRLQAAVDPGSSLPTLFVTGKEPFWRVPPGWVANWMPSDNHYQAVPVEGQTAAFEANFHGGISEFTRAQFKETGSARAVWLASDPMPDHQGVQSAQQTGSSVQDSWYAKSAILSAISWAARVPLVRTASWPGNAPGALLLSVDTEDRFENAADLRKIFAQARVPATFFLVSNLYQTKSSVFGHLDDQIELASHSENHDPFEGQSLTTQFDRIQASRLEIEELAERRVAGFRAPFERSDLQTLAAVAQNRLDYFVTDSRYLRYSPMAVADGKLLVFPRLALDDFWLQKKRDLVGAEEQAGAWVSEIRKAQKVNGMALINLHTQIFGQSEHHEVLERFLNGIKEERTWNTTFSAATRWWKDRGQLDVSIQSESTGQYDVLVKNSADHDIADVVLELDLGRPGTWALVSETDGSARAPASSAVLDQHHLKIAFVRAGETQRYRIKL